MSSGSISAYQNAGIGAYSGNVSAQQSPLQQQSLPPNPNMGHDRIRTQTEEIIAPPLLATGGPNNAAADSIVNSQVPGMAAIAGAGVVIAVAAALGIPLLVEATGKRAAANHRKYGESLEHQIRNMHRSAEDKTVAWIEHHENTHTKEFYINRVVADMKGTWARLHDASLNIEDRKAELKRARALGIPLKGLMETDNLDGHVGNGDTFVDELKKLKLNGFENLGGFVPLEPSTENLITTAAHVRDFLDSLHAHSLGDSDVRRYNSQQFGLLKRFFAGENIAHDTDPVALNRMPRYRDRTGEYQKAAQKRFANEIFVGLR